ncbi:MAG: SH3 domain-containing protein [Alphaproteobacteria bacterium]|nr:SH3 domain-containing protein [Alphaproteobacteria bacterium]
MFRVLFAAGWLCCVTAAFAQTSFLAGATIRQLVSGSVLFINTPLNTKLPIRYGADGQLSGNAGSMAFFLGAQKDTGRWWVARNRLCHRWARWFDGEPQCLKLKKRGTHIQWLSDEGKTGTAQIHRVKTPVTKPRSTNGHVAKRQTPSSKTRTVRTARVTPLRKSAPASKPAGKHDNLEQRLGAKASRGDVPAQKKSKVKASKTAKQAVTRPKARPDKSLTTTPRQTAWQRQPTFRVAHVADLDVLNIRQGPSEYHNIVGQIPSAGRGVKIVGACRAYWCPARYRNIAGWVNRYYLAADN